MPIQKTHTKTDGTVGDYWRLENLIIQARGGVLAVGASLYKSQADFAGGKTPMRQKNVQLVLADVLTPAQINVIRLACENALIAGSEPEFSGGTLV